MKTKRKLRVDLQNATRQKNIPKKAMFETWINAALSEAPDEIESSIKEICIRIVDTNESAYLNETYRGKKGPTNILSFGYDPIPNIPTESLGDLIICAEIVDYEAPQQTTAHWAHLSVHGTLHLLGYDHIEDDEAETMEQLEITILKTLGFDNPYE